MYDTKTLNEGFIEINTFNIFIKIHEYKYICTTKQLTSVAFVADTAGSVAQTEAIPIVLIAGQWRWVKSVIVDCSRDVAAARRTSILGQVITARLALVARPSFDGRLAPTLPGRHVTHGGRVS